MLSFYSTGKIVIELLLKITALIKVVCDHIEPLKPYGFLLGDTVPPSIKLPFAKKSK
jgi:hypothetical protein